MFVPDRRSLGGREPRVAAATFRGSARHADLDPPPPPSLVPGGSWHGIIAAPRPLAVGLYVRIVFGHSRQKATRPRECADQFSWITDNSYKLQGTKRG